jgi:ATP-dependent RNA helicase RhlE
MRFENYPIIPALKKSLEEAGFKRPTDIQFKAIPSILQGEDVMAIAQTGTGKTAAFVIPVLNILHHLEKEEEDFIKCLVMVPTRELAIQISEVFKNIGKYTDLKTTCVIGGVGQDSQIEELKKGTDILVATPGRMFDLVYQKFIKITKVKILILDEADLMLDLGFNKDIHDVVKFLPKVHQTLFFSATINIKIKDLAYSLVRNPIRIQISPKDRVSKNIDHAVAFIEMDDKRFFLERFIKETVFKTESEKDEEIPVKSQKKIIQSTEKTEKKVLVFVRTKVRAERVVQAMERVGIKCLSMHGGKEQEDRLAVMESFRKGEIKILVTTDVSARGIDIPNVEYVINYDVPEVVENYVHRVGRTGRGNNRGFAISFCSSEERPMLSSIEEYLEKEIREIGITKKEYTETLGQRKTKVTGKNF